MESKELDRRIDDILKRFLADVDDSMEFVGSQFNPKERAHDKVAASFAKAKAELEALLLGEDAPSDRSGVRLYQDDKDSEEYWTCKECGGYDECDCSGFNDSNTAWRQHIRNKLGSKGKDNE